jgi:hypothetical protein
MHELLEAKPTVIFVYGKEAQFLFNFEVLFELPLHILVWTSVGYQVFKISGGSWY